MLVLCIADARVPFRRSRGWRSEVGRYVGLFRVDAVDGEIVEGSIERWSEVDEGRNSEEAEGKT